MATKTVCSQVFSPEELDQLITILGHDNVKGILAGTLLVQVKLAPFWREGEHDKVIYFQVTSDGTSGASWIKRLEGKGFRVGRYAKSVLESPDFKPTSGVTYRLAAIRGTFWRTDNERRTKAIRAEAANRGWEKPNAEVACLFRELFSDEQLKELGLWYLVAMHEAIQVSDGSPELLYARRDGDGQWLDTYCGGPDDRWSDDGAFVFAVPQAPIKS